MAKTNSLQAVVEKTTMVKRITKVRKKMMKHLRVANLPLAITRKFFKMMTIISSDLIVTVTLHKNGISYLRANFYILAFLLYP